MFYLILHNNTDYLPSIFKTYCDDPDCSFLALTGVDNDKLLAVSNYRRIGNDIAWFEAVRTAEDARGKGYARSLLQEMLESAKNEGRKSLLSCTVASNIPMIKVFQKCGMNYICKLNMIDFSLFKTLPGWKRMKDQNNDSNEDKIVPQNLLSAMNLKHTIRENAKNPSKVTAIKTQLELDDALQRMHESGGTKFVPGLFSILSPSQLSSSLDKGLIFFIESTSKNNDNSQDSSSSGGDNNDEAVALLVLSRDERISSLKSNWICSIATNSHLALETALWYACFSSDVQDRLEDDVAFCLIFNDYDSSSGSNNEKSDFVSALPLAKDPCVLYGIQD